MLFFLLISNHWGAVAMESMVLWNGPCKGLGLSTILPLQTLPRVGSLVHWGQFSKHVLDLYCFSKYCIVYHNIRYSLIFIIICCVGSSKRGMFYENNNLIFGRGGGGGGRVWIDHDCCHTTNGLIPLLWGIELWPPCYGTRSTPSGHWLIIC